MSRKPKTNLDKLNIDKLAPARKILRDKLMAAWTNDALPSTQILFNPSVKPKRETVIGTDEPEPNKTTINLQKYGMTNSRKLIDLGNGESISLYIPKNRLNNIIDNLRLEFPNLQHKKTDVSVDLKKLSDDDKDKFLDKLLDKIVYERVETEYAKEIRAAQTADKELGIDLAPRRSTTVREARMEAVKTTETSPPSSAAPSRSSSTSSLSSLASQPPPSYDEQMKNYLDERLYELSIPELKKRLLDDETPKLYGVPLNTYVQDIYDQGLIRKQIEAQRNFVLKKYAKLMDFQNLTPEIRAKLDEAVKNYDQELPKKPWLTPVKLPPRARKLYVQGYNPKLLRGMHNIGHRK